MAVWNTPNTGAIIVDGMTSSVLLLYCNNVTIAVQPLNFFKVDFRSERTAITWRLPQTAVPQHTHSKGWFEYNGSEYCVSDYLKKYFTCLNCNTVEWCDELLFEHSIL